MKSNTFIKLILNIKTILNINQLLLNSLLLIDNVNKKLIMSTKKLNSFRLYSYYEFNYKIDRIDWYNQRIDIIDNVVNDNFYVRSFFC